jgi:hypothetical protein
MHLKSLALACLYGFVTSAGHTDEIKAASVFTGNETRILVPNSVNADCTSGPRPELRISTPPVSGTIRLEPIAYVISRPAGDSRAHCNGRRKRALWVSTRWESKPTSSSAQ